MPIGFHILKNGRDLSAAMREDVAWGRESGVNITCGQIFVTGPQTFSVSLPPRDRPAVKHAAEQLGVKLVIHGAYIDNPWGRAPKSLHNIKLEMEIAAEIGARGVIVHLAKKAADLATLEYVIKTISESLSNEIKAQCILYFEINPAKPAPHTFETNAKLNVLFDRIAAIDKQGLQIGLCIDTAHLWSCGFDDREYLAAKNWLDGLPRNIPIMMHLNDSAGKLADGRDRHAALTKGNIWGEYNPTNGVKKFEDSGLSAILEWAEFNEILTILERDEDELISDFNLIQRLGYFMQD